MFLAAQGAMAAGIANTKHDFSATFGGGQICNACHAPHNTSSTSLLWNHTASSATYTLYSNTAGGSLNAAMSQPGSVSKLCLSCHDGTVAVDSFGGATAPTGAFIGAPGNLGTSLGDDHPIGFTYDAALATADGGLTSPVSASLVKTGVAVPLYSAKMECASCHDVHNAPGVAKLLRIANTSSALCTTCHIK